MAYLDFVIDHQQSFVVRCSFCDALERVDIPIGEQQARGITHETVKTNLQRHARDKGWRTVETTHGVRLNYCPNHTHLITAINPPQERSSE